ncbi:MAG: VCBS repeat-containing protein, partial [Dolichospermum sp.]|nr:VCBS repeat-containing protein [Dolichospermum sp.]
MFQSANRSGLDLKELGTSGLVSLEKSQGLITSLDTRQSSAPQAQEDPLIPLPIDALPDLQIPVGGSANPNPNPYLTSAAIVPDFNGDGKTDKLWVNVQTGEILVRLMNGTQVLEQSSLGQYDLTTWEYKTADFNSDNKTDFLLRNKTTGENVVVLMDGARVASFMDLDRVDPGWNANIGDFNG